VRALPSGEGDEGTAKTNVPPLRVFRHMRPANLAEKLDIFLHSAHAFLGYGGAVLFQTDEIPFHCSDYFSQLFEFFHRLSCSGEIHAMNRVAFETIIR